MHQKLATEFKEYIFNKYEVDEWKNMKLNLQPTK
jgi:hypothetical protein